MTTITVARPGLANTTITVTAASTVNRSFRLVGSYAYEGVTVDGRFFPLVRAAHFEAHRAMLRPELDGVMADLSKAVRQLNLSW